MKNWLFRCAYYSYGFSSKNYGTSAAKNPGEIQLPVLKWNHGTDSQQIKHQSWIDPTSQK